MKKMLYTLALGVLSVSPLSAPLFAQITVSCRCVHGGIIDQAEMLEGETPLEACQSLGQGFVPLHN